MTSRNFSRAAILRLLLFALSAAIACVLLPVQSRGQASASISGTVYDNSGGYIPNATVVPHDRGTNLDRTTQTNDVGMYTIPEVRPGSYDLKVTKQRFKSVVRSGVTLVVNQAASLDVTLSPGSLSENVVVAAEALALETSTSELGVAVVKDQVNDLPLNGRNFTQLLDLTPGVSK